MPTGEAEGDLLITTYAGLFLAAAYDRTGTPAPAVAGGIAAAMGTLNIFLVIGIATIAGAIGEMAFYVAGRASRSGARCASRFQRPGRLDRFVPEKLRDIVRPSVVGHPAVLLFGRFLPVVGRLVAPLAGVGEVPLRTMAMFTAASQLLLVSSYSFLAYLTTRILGPSSAVSVAGGAVFAVLWVLPFLGGAMYGAVAGRRARGRNTSSGEP